MLEPWNERWALGLADMLLSLGRHTHALQHYLLAGALQTCFFSGGAQHANSVVAKWGTEEALRSFVLLEDRVLRRLLHCLLACHHATAALVLCQCLNPPDYTLAFAHIHDKPAMLASDYFRYLWEIPILEKLIHLTSTAQDQQKKSILIRVIQNPELNEYNSKEFKQACVTVLKMNFFKALFIDLGSGVPSNLLS